MRRPLPGRLRGPEREQRRSNRAPATALLTPRPCHRQTKIRDTLNNLILKSPQNWQTSVGLPFFQIEGTVVEWDEVRFDVRLMQRVPYEGVSRMQTSLRRKHRDRVVRRSARALSNPLALHAATRVAR